MGVFGDDFFDDDVILDAIQVLDDGEDFTKWFLKLLEIINSENYIQYDDGAEFVLLLQFYMFEFHAVLPITELKLNEVPVDCKGINNESILKAIELVTSENSEYYELRIQLFDDTINEYLLKCKLSLQ